MILTKIIILFFLNSFASALSPLLELNNQVLPVVGIPGVPPWAKPYNKLKKYYLPSKDYIDNDNCSDVVDAFGLTELAQGVPLWIVKMMDSWGKIPDGFLFGNIHIIGMYEECLKIEASVETRKYDIFFKGRYCKIFYKQIKDDTSSPMDRSGPGIAILVNPLPFYYATCMPSTCTEEDLFVSVNAVMGQQNRTVVKLECQAAGEKQYHATEFDGFDAFVVALLILFFILSIFGTIIEENNLQRFAITEGGRRIMAGLMCFSLTKSFKHIFRYQGTADDAITCVHGLRVITIIWIITCHQYETAVDFIVNLLNAKKYQDPYMGQLITDGYQSVDTFFTLSGILLAYRLFPSILSGKGLTAGAFIGGYFVSLFRRFMRLFPCILMVAMFCATSLRFLGFGPRAPQLDQFAEQCRDTWWKDPLFVNNLVHGEGNSVVTDDCLDHCWYTSVEMQLFLIVPFVFLPRIYNKFIGFWWLSFLTLMSQVIPLIILIINEFPPVLFPYLTLTENQDFYTKYYDSPWCRSAPWFIGIWTGIIMVKYSHILKKLKKVHVIIGYAIAIILGFVIVVGLYRYNHLGKHSEISNFVSGLYAFFSRPLWAIAVSWVVITCYTKNAWYVNAALSWWGWQPLSRLTFCIYLVSPVVQLWWATTLYVPIYYSYMAKLFEVCGVVFISFIVSLILSCLVEGPFLRLSEIASSRVLKSRSIKRQTSSQPSSERY